MRYQLVVYNPIKVRLREQWSYRKFPQFAENINLREIDSVYSEAEMDCPLGGINCRNCGDSNYTDSCKDAGHCEQCGTAHGVSPNSILNEYGFKLVLVS